jgi:hypothetical protein
MVSGGTATGDGSPVGFDDIRAWATCVADTWYRSADQHRPFDFDGLDAGRALRVEVFNLMFSAGLDALGMVSDLDRPGIAPWLKQRGMDRPVRAWSMRVQSAYARTRLPLHPDVVVVSEIATPSSLLGPAAIARTFEAGAVAALAADPRAFRFWASQGVPVRALTCGLADERRIQRTASRQTREAWQVFERQPPILELGGRDLTTAVLPRLGRLVRGSLPWLHVERQAIRRAFDQTQPRAILLASDQHRTGVLVTAEARTLGIPTAVMQHGLTQHDVGYVPVAADRIFTWSQQSSAWFLERHTPPDRLTVVGNPAFDTLTSGAASRISEVARDGAARIILALTPSTKDINTAVVTTALAAIDQLPGAVLTVKLHPGDGNWQYIRDLVHSSGMQGRIEVAHREPISPMIARSTVTWLHRSSVALESLAAGVPVVVIEAGAPSTADLELRGLSLPTAPTATALARLTRELLEPEARVAYFSARPIADFTGPAHGTAAGRAHDALTSLSTTAPMVAT